MSSHWDLRHVRRFSTSLLVTILLVTGASAGTIDRPAEQTGATLTGRVIFRGTIPAPNVVTVTRDPEICGATRTLQPLVVETGTNGLLNAVVSIDGENLLPPPEATWIANDHCMFAPHVEVIRVGSALEISNRDPLLHNTHITFDSRTFINVALVAGGKPVRKLVKQPGLFNVRCDVHRFMQGYVVAFNHPYYSVTQASGDFQIVGVPPGRHNITVWHETLGTLQREVTIPTKGDLSLTLEFP